jgi:RimJ/RimL family protein N-acetyltransferase
MSGTIRTERNPHAIGYGIFLRSQDGASEGSMLGVASLWHAEEPKVEVSATPALYELGYILHPDAWGKGYATEAVVALLKLRGSTKVLGKVHVPNFGSKRVLEKAGFVETGQNMEPRGMVSTYMLY